MGLQVGERGLRSFKPEKDSYAEFLGSSGTTEADVHTGTTMALEFWALLDSSLQGTDTGVIFGAYERAESGQTARHNVYYIWDSDNSWWNLYALFRPNASGNPATQSCTVSNVDVDQWNHIVLRYVDDTTDYYELAVGNYGDSFNAYSTSTSNVVSGTSLYPIGDGPRTTDSSGETQLTFGDRRQHDLGLGGLIALARVWSKALSDADVEENAWRMIGSETGLEHQWAFQATSGNVVDTVTGAVELAYTKGASGEQGYGVINGYAPAPCHPFLNYLNIGNC